MNDGLSMPGLGGTTAAALRLKGFRSLEDLVSRPDPELLTAIKNPVTARKVRAQARALLTGKPVILSPKPLPHPQAVVVDIETSLAGNDPWLIGYTVLGSGSVTQHEALEREQHVHHLRRVADDFQRFEGRPFIEWGSFDRGVLEKAYRLNGLDVPSWLNPTRWLDACRWLKHAVCLPVQGYGLKEVSAYFDYRYQIPGLDGFVVGGLYSTYLRTGRPFPVGDVKQYNRDDVLSVEHILSAIQGLLTSESILTEPAIEPAKRTRDR